MGKKSESAIADSTAPAAAEPLAPPAEGGSYVIENGVRRRVEAPTAPAPTTPAQPAKGE